MDRCSPALAPATAAAGFTLIELLVVISIISLLVGILPAPRNAVQPGFIFADGHAAAKPLKQMNDLNGDGVFDNGYWTGLGDANPALR